MSEIDSVTTDGGTPDAQGMDTVHTPAEQQVADTSRTTEQGASNTDTPDDGMGTNDPHELEQRLTDAEARADKYARALFDARVAATGKLADPTDMPFNAALVDDVDALANAIDALLAVKPHLANRRPAWGDVGAGQTTHTEGGPTWADLFKRH